METTTTVIVRQTHCDYCETTLWIFISIVTAVITVLGNVLTILAILLSKKLSSLLANYFVFSLAVSDLFVGCSIPYHMLFYLAEDFGQSKLNCLTRFALTSFACSSSICNLLIIATDRYVAVVYPLHYVRFMTKRMASCLITLGWLTASTMATIPLIWNDWRDGIQCEMVDVLPYSYLKYILSPMFALIWIAMLLLYTRICQEAAGQVKRIRGSTSSGLQQLSITLKDSKSFQMMLLILGCFTICWLPYLIVILYIRSNRELHLATLYEIFFNLAMANSSMNPLIYAWKNTNFRKAFICLLKCHYPDHQNARYITDHVPSKRSSMNGIYILESEVTNMTKMNGADMEMQPKFKEKRNSCISVIKCELE